MNVISLERPVRHHHTRRQKALDSSISEILVIADDNLSVTGMMEFSCEMVEKIVEIGENTGDQFSPISAMFSKGFTVGVV